MIVVGIISALICTLLLIKSYIINSTYLASVSSIWLTVSVLIILASLEENYPQAIDVYRNNTELKVTYEICNGDTLSCDSTVVFKQKTI